MTMRHRTDAEPDNYKQHASEYTGGYIQAAKDSNQVPFNEIVQMWADVAQPAKKETNPIRIPAIFL